MRKWLGGLALAAAVAAVAAFAPSAEATAAPAVAVPTAMTVVASAPVSAFVAPEAPEPNKFLAFAASGSRTRLEKLSDQANTFILVNEARIAAMRTAKGCSDDTAPPVNVADASGAATAADLCSARLNYICCFVYQGQAYCFDHQCECALIVGCCGET